MRPFQFAIIRVGFSVSNWLQGTLNTLGSNLTKFLDFEKFSPSHLEVLGYSSPLADKWESRVFTPNVLKMSSKADNKALARPLSECSIS